MVGTLSNGGWKSLGSAPQGAKKRDSRSAKIEDKFAGKFEVA